MTDHQTGTVVFFVAGFIVVIVFHLLRGAWRFTLDDRSATVGAQMEQLLRGRTDLDASDLTYSETAQSLLALDESRLRFTQYFLREQQIWHQTADIHDVLDAQLLVIEESTAHAIGAATGVGESSLIGAGQALSFTAVRSITLRLLMNSTESPVWSHDFLTSAGYGTFDSKSSRVSDALAEATRFKAILDVLMARAKVRWEPTVPMVLA